MRNPKILSIETDLRSVMDKRNNAVAFFFLSMGLEQYQTANQSLFPKYVHYVLCAIQYDQRPVDPSWQHFFKLYIDILYFASDLFFDVSMSKATKFCHTHSSAGLFCVVQCTFRNSIWKQLYFGSGRPKCWAGAKNISQNLKAENTTRMRSLLVSNQPKLLCNQKKKQELRLKMMRKWL